MSTTRMGGEGLALGVVGALALAAAATSRLGKARGSANLSAARREAFDALAEAYHSYASKVSAFIGTRESRNFAKSNGINFLGDGSFRAVFSVPEGALKIQKRRYQNEKGQPAFGENEKEVQIWRSAPAGIRKSLVPILDHAHDYAWVLMPEVEMGGTLDPEKIKGLSACGIGDLRSQNVSRDGRIVDYSIIESTQALSDCLARGRAQRSTSGSAARSRGIKIEPADNTVRAEALRPSMARGSANLSAARRNTFDALAEAYRGYALRAGRGERNPTPEENQRFGRSKRMKFLGSGWSRAVFRVPEGALKIELGWAPFTENQSEAQIWGAAPASLAPHLVPVLDHADDYSWILMPEIEVGGTLDLAVAKALADCGICDFQDRNTSTDGRLVDYAFIFDNEKLAGCLEQGRAQRLSAATTQGSAARRGSGSKNRAAHGKTWAELHEDLSEIGHGVLGEQILSTTLKTCSSTAPAVMQYLLERGHVVAPGGQDRPSGYTHHYDLAVLTSDRGWLNIDPTFMQFHCKHQPSEDEDEGEDWSDLAELKRHLQNAWADPMATYRIDPLPWPPTPRGEVEVKAPPTLSKVNSWAEYWAKYRRLATSAVDKARRETAGENVGRFKPGPYAYLISS